MNKLTHKTTWDAVRKLCLVSLVAVSAVNAQAAEKTSRGDSDLRSPDSVHSGFYHRRVAVCVGINNYTMHSPLTCAEGDATAMARVFGEWGFDEVKLITGRDATREAIFAALENHKATAGKNDLLVFFFAGHGWTVREGAGLAGYLVPFGARKGFEAADGIAMARMKEMADSMPNRHTLFLMDACYAGYGLSEGITSDAGGRRAKVSAGTLAVAVERPAVQIITAGGEIDKAFEADGHGLFTRQILDRLDKASENGETAILGSQLATFVRTNVKKQTGGWQTPQFGYAGAGDIVLAKAPAKMGVVARAF